MPRGFGVGEVTTSLQRFSQRALVRPGFRVRAFSAKSLREACKGAASDRSPVRGGSDRASQKELYQVHQQPMSESGMRTSVQRSEWKDRASRGKDSTDQGQLGLIGAVPPMGAAEADFIERCSWEGACRYAVQRSGKDDFEVADDIGISHGYISKVLKGTAGLWGKRLARFMRQTQCIAPLQWLANEVGCDVVPRSSQAAEIARLRALLKEVERGAA